MQTDAISLLERAQGASRSRWRRLTSNWMDRLVPRLSIDRADEDRVSEGLVEAYLDPGGCLIVVAANRAPEREAAATMSDDASSSKE